MFGSPSTAALQIGLRSVGQFIRYTIIGAESLKSVLQRELRNPRVTRGQDLAECRTIPRRVGIGAKRPVMKWHPKQDHHGVR